MLAKEEQCDPENGKYHEVYVTTFERTDAERELGMEY